MNAWLLLWLLRRERETDSRPTASASDVVDVLTAIIVFFVALACLIGAAHMTGFDK